MIFSSVELIVNLTYSRALDRSRFVEMDVDVLAKTRRIVISNGFGIAKGFQDRIGFQNLLFYPGVFATDGRQILQN